MKLKYRLTNSQALSAIVALTTQISADLDNARNRINPDSRSAHIVLARKSVDAYAALARAYGGGEMMQARAEQWRAEIAELQALVQRDLEGKP